MDKEEIKDYLKRVDELGAKLTGENKETYTWLIYGYNQCAKLLNETEQQVQKQKEVIYKTIMYLEKFVPIEEDTIIMRERQRDYLLDILKEVTNNE